MAYQGLPWHPFNSSIDAIFRFFDHHLDSGFLPTIFHECEVPVNELPQHQPAGPLIEQPSQSAEPPLVAVLELLSTTINVLNATLTRNTHAALLPEARRRPIGSFLVDVPLPIDAPPRYSVVEHRRNDWYPWNYNSATNSWTRIFGNSTGWLRASKSNIFYRTYLTDGKMRTECYYGWGPNLSDRELYIACDGFSPRSASTLYAAVVALSDHRKAFNCMCDFSDLLGRKRLLNDKVGLDQWERRRTGGKKCGWPAFWGAGVRLAVKKHDRECSCGCLV